jgi:hypothetical protein
MVKRFSHIVPGTQQEIRTKVERSEDQLTVELRACQDLDGELRDEFRKQIDALETDSITVNTTTYRSNQGNELGEHMTVRSDTDNQLQAVDVVNDVVQIGKEFYEKQLERELGREEDSDSSYHSEQQLLYFDDEAEKKFTLLFNGRVDF